MTMRDDPTDPIYDDAQEQQQLALVIGPHYERMLAAVHAAMVATIPALVGWRLDDAATRRILAHAAERVVRIDQTTRDAIREMLQRGQALGLSDWSLANGSPKDGYPGIDGLFRETWRNRALVVARTELAESQVTAARDRFLMSGLVDRMEISDGVLDEPCARRNGTTVPVSTAVQTLHPNCTVSVRPLLRDGVVP